jgi:hypothetical protein
MSGALVQPCGNAGCDKTFQPQRFGRRRRYCSPRCRTAAHRQIGKPRDTEAGAKQAKSLTCPIENIGELDRPSLQNRATAPLGHQGSPGVGEGLLSAPATFVTESPKAHIGRPSRHPKAIPDAVYPGMWRVRWPDGRVSDMTNLSRVNDAIACFLGAA